MRNTFALSYLLFISASLTILFLSGCQTPESTASASVLSGKVICVDAGHGGTAATDSYRVGAGGEREEWINLRVARDLKKLLEAEGARVLMTRSKDTHVDLQARAMLAVDQKADVFLSIHHNATADTSVNFPIIYYHANASENKASVQLAQLVGQQLLQALFPQDTLISIASDHTIFPKGGTAVLRHSYGIPGIIGEASFFTNPSEEEQLRQESYNQQEAQAYLQSLITFFGQEIPTIEEKYSRIQLPPFAVLQEAERMHPTARLWLQDYQQGKALYDEHQLDTAYQLLTRSARSFPDSYVAGEAHLLRAEILAVQDSLEAATATFQRVKEYYVGL
ncbi:N-acetylmuramoyl-L-alanine amidase [Catalinimonas niigatensis]|uniref:N-acetylmuramoyl-L-alanine amidase n=1 Tax=Catalinimonas niigatensis TaxID=1397264 RepID=UPI002665AC5F|nr:N-acetylmuramoyl-L-alanine amidase [Catalinimonas niigatensis]WPP50376.1 N-acetylmuramoyl-L-alanine amidase [Catalinimonas niigatensis]